MGQTFPPGYKLVSIKPDPKQIYELRKALGFSVDNPTDEEQKIIVAMIQAYSTLVDAAHDYMININVSFQSENEVNKLFFDPTAWTPNEINKDNDL